MMFRKIVKLLSIFLVVLISIVPIVNANPVVSGIIIWEPGMVITMFFAFIATFVVEIIIIIIFLGSNEPVENYKKFYKSVFAVNLFTFPITQVIAFILFQFDIFSGALTYTDNYIIIYSLNYILTSSILIEPFPIILECLLYLKIFKTFNRSYYFKNQVEKKTIIISTISANLITYLIGIGIFLNPILY